MKPSALVISVGLVATFGFGDAPILAAQTTACDAGTLINNVSVLKLPFHTDYYYGKYSRPQSDSTVLSQTIVTDLTKAFSIAPNFLCSNFAVSMASSSTLPNARMAIQITAAFPINKWSGTRGVSASSQSDSSHPVRHPIQNRII